MKSKRFLLGPRGLRGAFTPASTSLLTLLLLISACANGEASDSRLRPGPDGSAGAPSGGGPNAGGAPVILADASTAGADSGGPSCGNGLLEIGELCDDGNKQDGDGCAADCLTQDPSYTCSPGERCVKAVICGNGYIEGEESCDDGNSVGGDGCSADCMTIQDGYVCSRPGSSCMLLPVCGNGTRERGEQCDDGEPSPSDGDGCSAECQLEDGFFCAVPGEPCIEEVCGDGTRTPGEACDDGNHTNGDGCSDTCTVESGWRCTALSCTAECGDGRILGAETCDDGNRTSGDGCSGNCKQEPFWSCSGAPSHCVSTIVCGNGTREPGEVCDPPGVDGCEPGCKSFAPSGTIAVCGNGVIEYGETCDPPNVGNGCGASCEAEAGYTCPQPGVCVRTPYCGDAVVQFQLGEACDVGALPSDGCVACSVQPGWSCFGLGPSICLHETCGDGIRTPSEECDDGNAASGDGCDGCQLEEGWLCPYQGEACFPRCGDGLLLGDEDCDDGNAASGDGCNAGCRIELGYSCPKASEPCVESVCGNGILEPGEGCDDGDRVAGDGCGPTCQLEPIITPGPNPTVQVFCGDGMVTGSEDCDDGNADDGDGCRADCKVEAGFTCSDVLDLPPSIDMQVIYRDFRSSNATLPGGHPDFQHSWAGSVTGIAGVVCTSSNTATCGKLDTAGKPVLGLAVPSTAAIRDASTFGLWYRSVNSDGVTHNGHPIQIWPHTSKLTLTQSTPFSPTYVFEQQDFFPLDGMGYGSIGAEVPLCKVKGKEGVTTVASPPDGNCCECDTASGCRGHNFGFTTELRYFFQYQGGETLTFYGDDDVFVYVNGRLAVDIGGVHPQLYGRVVLGDDGLPGGTDSDCSAQGAGALPDLGGCYSAAEQADSVDARFGLTKGNVYEIVLFHAERATTGSNFKLTLSGFLAPRSYCTPLCGDGIVVAGEVCDDGPDNADGVSGACSSTCMEFAHCGDGIVQTGEACDNGENLHLYGETGDPDACSPGCVLPPKCGDNIVQAGYEECDNGAANDDNSYGSTGCTTACKLGGFCGDGVVNGPVGLETCDQGAQNGVSYGSDSCGYDCKRGPYCGDGVRNGPEECDGTAECGTDCKFVPYCGDGITSVGEQCDYAQFASYEYGSCTPDCGWGPRCGDAALDDAYEECDLGKAFNLGGYDGCTDACNRGPHCGDGLVQASHGEQCDNGYNDDTYQVVSTACGPGCLAPPRCGDGTVQSEYELCDEGTANSDTAYDGCTSACEWGPYCGDGTLQPPELCDNGALNRAYTRDAGGCGYDCKPAPYCGDGERNGPEQCDEGTTKNAGTYGGCNADCTLAPRCGDRVVQSAHGEQCDDGPIGSLDCTADCRSRTIR
jgi:fibro-slime domain-containing protein